MNALNSLAPSADTCCPACGAAASDTALAIACTLGAGDFKERVAGIRALAERSLHHSERAPLALHLTYGPEAREEVEAVVAAETECCAFLAFDLERDDRGVHLTITAPEDAAAAVDELFAHFAPDLARTRSGVNA